MKKAVIIHGLGADSQSNWFPWLKKELEKNDFKVNAPDFPDSENPLLPEWLSFFKNTVNINQNTIVIGHSLGVPFILRLLENYSRQSKPLKAAFLVAGFERSLGFPQIDNFVIKKFNWQKIKNSCKKFFVINSDNDPFIPLNIGQSLAENLGVKLILEPGAEHIIAPKGLLKYPRLLNLILAMKD